MDTFTQPKITGYRQLNETEAALMNEIKAKGSELEDLVVKVQDYLIKQAATAQREYVHKDDVRRLEIAQPARWAAIGRTHFQEGLMALVRAVAQPSSF